MNSSDRYESPQFRAEFAAELARIVSYERRLLLKAGLVTLFILVGLTLHLILVGAWSA